MKVYLNFWKLTVPSLDECVPVVATELIAEGHTSPSCTKSVTYELLAARVPVTFAIASARPAQNSGDLKAPAHSTVAADAPDACVSPPDSISLNSRKAWNIEKLQ